MPRAKRRGIRKLKKKTDDTGRSLIDDVRMGKKFGNKLFGKIDFSDEMHDYTRSTDQQNTLNNYWAKADPRSTGYAGNRSADTTDYLARFKKSLDGYSSNEYDMFREQASSGIDSDYATRLNQLKRSAGANRVRGAASIAQILGLNKERVAAQRGLESDLFVKSADEKQRRLESYGQALRGVEGDEHTRARDAAKDHSDYLSVLDKLLFDKKMANADLEGRESAANRASAIGFAGMLESMRTGRKSLEIAEKNANKPIPSPAMPDFSGLLALLANSGGGESYDPSKEVFV